MRPIIGVNIDCLRYGYVGTYATPLHPYLPPGAMGSSGEGSQGPQPRVKFSFCGRPTVEPRRNTTHKNHSNSRQYSNHMSNQHAIANSNTDYGFTVP